ncbi:MAG: DUF6789 family protein [Chloroflexia bacterium]
MQSKPVWWATSRPAHHGCGLDVVGAKGAHPDARRAMSLAAHFGFGIASGGLFGALHRRLADVVNVHPILTGVVFGTLVWAVSYMGWVPALSIMPSPDRDRPSRPWAMVIAHWVYGATLGAVLQRLLRRELRARRSVP